MARVCLGLVLLIAGNLWAAETAVPLTLQNPGFEDDLEGWQDTTGPTFAGAISATTEVKHEGEAALHIMSDEPGQWPWLMQGVAGLEPGATYALSAWYKGSAAAQNMAAVKLEFLGDNGQRLGQALARALVKDDKWQQLTAAGLAPPGTQSARVMLRLAEGGEVWFDDVSLTRTTEAPLLLPSRARLAVAPGQEQTVSLGLHVRAGGALPAGPATVNVLLGAKTLKSLTIEFKMSDGGLLTAAVTLPVLNPADYTLQMVLGEATATWALHVTAARRPPGLLTPTGVLKAGGQVVIPVGLYHVAVADYPTLAKQGFNMVQGPASHDLRQLGPALQAASGLRLGQVIPLYAGGQVAQNMAFTQQKLKAFGKHPAVVGWKLADEPDINPAVAGEIPDAYRKLKALDPVHPVVLTVAAASQAALWGQFCDVLEVAVFPLPDQPLTMVGEQIAQARQALQPWQGLWALLQAGWLPGGANQPRVEQARAMAYLAFLKGATGVFWYSFRDPGWHLAQSQLWGKFTDLNAEAREVGSLILTGTAQEAKVEGDPLPAGVWMAGGKLLLVAANPEPRAQSATLRLAQPLTKAEVLKGEGTAEVKEGAVVVSFTGPGAALVQLTP